MAATKRGSCTHYSVFRSLQSLRGRVSDLEKKESQLIRSEHRLQASLYMLPWQHKLADVAIQIDV